MSAVYKMEKNPPKKGSNKKAVLHPRIVPWDTIETEELIKCASNRSTFTEGDLKGAMQMISDIMEEKLRDGYIVKLDGIGYFSVSLQSRPVEDKKELRSESVHFKNVNFRCCTELKHALKTMPVTRQKEYKKTEFSAEEKERRLLWYLERHGYITTSAYQGMNGCTSYIARKELKQFVSDGLLIEDGPRKICIYVKRPEPAELPDSLVVDSNIENLQS